MAGDLKYRADIDGLRTLAVVPVVLFHAGVSLFSGGYVGVDIFFVISGYLITGILLGNIEKNTFSIIDFYKRRIRRIFPALLVVLALTTLAAWLLLTPERLVDYGKSLGSVSVFGSNIYFWKAVDYFSTRAHVQPLLHTWSLAVEEQFYIFYPVLLFVLAKLRMRFVPVLLLVGAVSLALACLLLGRMPGAVFYMLPMRAWELVIGGLLACGFPRVSANTEVNLGAAVLGVLLLVYAVVFYTAETPFPGLAAVPPTLGAALLIWSGTGQQGPVHRLLSTPPFVLVGRASYSFYLWHFPIFAFAAYLYGGKFTVQIGLLLSVVALLASLATLRWIETPFRRSKAGWSVMVPLAAMVLAGITGLIFARSDGFPARLPAEARVIALTPGDKTLHHEECMSVGDVIVPVRKACQLGQAEAKPQTMLWGDSHAMVTATAMESEAKALGQSFLFVATADCPVGLGFAISTATQSELTTTPAYRHCATYNRDMARRIVEDPTIRSVVLSARWTNWRIGEPGNPIEKPGDIRLEDSAGMAKSPADNARIAEAGLDQLLATLTKAGKAVFIVGPLPEPRFDVPQTLFVARYGLLSPPQPIAMKDYQDRHRHTLQILDRMGRKYPVRFIWPQSILCQQGICPLVRGGKPVFFDHNHLSVDAARRTAPLYVKVFSQDHR